MHMVKKFFGAREFFMRISRRSAIILFLIVWLWYNTSVLARMDATHMWDTIPEDMFQTFQSQFSLRAFFALIIALVTAVNIFIESVFLRLVILLGDSEPPLSLSRSMLISMLAYVPWIVFTMVAINVGGEKILLSHAVNFVFVLIHALVYWIVASSGAVRIIRSFASLFLVAIVSIIFAIPQFV